MQGLMEYETLIFRSIPSQSFWVRIFLTNYIKKLLRKYNMLQTLGIKSKNNFLNAYSTSV